MTKRELIFNLMTMCEGGGDYEGIRARCEKALKTGRGIRLSRYDRELLGYKWEDADYLTEENKSTLRHFGVEEWLD